MDLINKKINCVKAYFHSNFIYFFITMHAYNDSTTITSFLIFENIFNT